MPKGDFRVAPLFIFSQAKLMSRQLDHGRETLMDIFHRHRLSNEGYAASVLERAMQTAEHRPEALVWKAWRH